MVVVVVYNSISKNIEKSFFKSLRILFSLLKCIWRFVFVCICCYFVVSYILKWLQFPFVCLFVCFWKLLFWILYLSYICILIRHLLPDTLYTIHVCMYVYLFKVIMETFRNKILYLTLLLIFSLSLSFSLSLESKRNFLVKV